MNEVEIVVTSTDKTNFDAIKRSAENAGGGISQTFKDIGKTAGGFLVAEIATQLAGWAADGLGWLWDGTKLASDTKESMNKVNAVFGDSASTIQTFAKDASTSLGLSERSALDAAGTFGNMFDQLKFGTDVSADMSQGMIGLAADLGSFNNADITDVIDAQTAAFRGEYDSLQRFIPTINAAAVEQEALAISGKKSSKELTAQDKAMAVYSLMLENAGKATGDFAATSDSAANQQKILAAETENLQAKIGDKLLPITNKITEAKLALVSVIADKVIPKIGELSSTLRDKLEPAWQWWLDNKGDIAQGFQDAWDWVYNKLSPSLSGAKDAAQGFFDEVPWDKIKDDIIPLIGLAAGTWQSYAKMLITIIDLHIRAFTSATTSLTEFNRNHEESSTLMGDLWNAAVATITAKLTILKSTFNLVTAAIEGDWFTVFYEMNNIAHNIFSAIIGTMGGFLVEGVKRNAKIAWNGLKNGVQEAVNWVINQIERIPVVIGGIPARAAGSIGGAIKSIVSAPARALSKAIPKRALGGMAGGLTMVAEQAAELLQTPGGGQLLALPSGTRVQNGANTARMLGGGGGGGQNIYITVNVAGSIVSERDLKGVMANAIRGGGLDRLSSSSTR